MARARTGGKRITTPDGVRVIGRAANGAGTVFFDVSSGRWRARWTDSGGQRRTVTAATREAVIARRIAAQVVPAAPRTLTVADAARRWLAHAATTVRPGTHASYTHDVARLIDRIGHLPLAELDRDAVRDLIAAMHAEGAAAGTIRNTRARLGQICAEAVDAGLMAANPVRGTRLPVATADRRTQRRVLTLDEQRRLLAVLDPARRYDAAVGLLFTAGLRASEALGLAWSDVDLDAATAAIVRGCTALPDVGPVLDRPKTARTAGVVHLAPIIVRLLADHRSHQDTQRRAAWPTIRYEGVVIEPVFRTAGGQLGRQQYVHRALRDALARAGIDADRVGTHTGRRTVVTNLWVDGVALEDVAGYVGHASTATTARYIHDLGDRPRATAERAAGLFDPGV